MDEDAAFFQALLMVRVVRRGVENRCPYASSVEAHQRTSEWHGVGVKLSSVARGETGRARSRERI